LQKIDLLEFFCLKTISNLKLLKSSIFCKQKYKYNITIFLNNLKKKLKNKKII